MPSTFKDYDAWQAEDREILQILTDCAVRHKGLVDAYMRLQAVARAIEGR